MEKRGEEKKSKRDQGKKIEEEKYRKQQGQGKILEFWHTGR